MSYKSILTMLDNTEHCSSRTQFAADLAFHHGGCLIGVAPQGCATSLVVDDFAGPDSSWLTMFQQQINADSNLATGTFNIQCKNHRLELFESRIVRGSSTEAMSKQSLFSDLIVLGQKADKTDSVMNDEGLIEHLLLTSGRPILLVPRVGAYKAIADKVLVAWRDSRESSLAIRQAMPILQSAKEVEIVMVQKQKEAYKRTEASHEHLLHYLKLHDVKASFRCILSDLDAANTLLSHACDSGDELLVMGGYGHARLKEWALGGVTRTILQTMTLPVLMAH